MVEKHFNKGDVIFCEGDSGDSFFHIIKGKVDVIVNYGKDDETKLTELGAGKIFGEMAALDYYRRSATIVAAEDDTVVKEVSQKDIDVYFDEQPEKILEIMRSISSRIRELTKDYNEVLAALNDPLTADRKKQDAGFMAKIKKFLFGVPTQTVQELQEADHSKGFARKVETYPAGTIVFKEGDPGDCMYDVHFGKVGIYTGYGTDDEKLITEVYPNRFFGEMGMIDNETRSATAVVLENETTLETIYSDDLADLIKKNPPKVNMIMMYLSNRLRTLTNDYIDACKKLYDAEN